MITLICSNFNSAKWISGYLTSINNQLYPEFDVHFVDGGSTDGSWDVIKNYKFRSGIKTKYSVRKGCSIYEAWNVGFGQAETEYCMNFNADDRLFPAALTVASEYIKNDSKTDVFYSPCFIVQDERHSAFMGMHDWVEFSKEELLKNCICGPFPVVKRQAAIDVGLFNPKFTISGDYEMWLRMEANGKKFKKIPEPLGSYYLNPTGVSSDPTKFDEHVKQDTAIRRMYA